MQFLECETGGVNEGLLYLDWSVTWLIKYNYVRWLLI